MDRIGLYFLQLGWYYLLDIPFLVLLAVLVLRAKSERRSRFWVLHFPLFLTVILALHWIFFGLGPRYSIILLLKSAFIDAVAHAVPLAAVLGTAAPSTEARRRPV